MKQSLSHALQSMGDDVLRPFHLAFPVVDLPAARSFYTEILGCTVGREKPESCVLNLHGHQIVAHCVDSMPGLATNPVDADYFDIAGTTYDSTTAGKDGAFAYNFTGNFVWVRAVINYTDGTISSIMLNH